MIAVKTNSTLPLRLANKPAITTVNSVGDDKARQHFLLVQYPNQGAMDEFGRLTVEQDISKLRNEATRDYIWKLYQPWNLEEWEN